MSMEVEIMVDISIRVYLHCSRLCSLPFSAYSVLIGDRFRSLAIGLETGFIAYRPITRRYRIRKSETVSSSGYGEE